MAKIIELSFDAGYYYELGISKTEDGDLIGAIDCFYRALEYEPNNPLIYSELAFDYLELGLVRQAKQQYFKQLTLDRRMDTPYCGLMQCLIQENDMQTALYYLNMGIENGVLEDTSGLPGDEAENTPPRPELKIISKKRLDNEKIAAAKSLAISGETELARRFLEEIPETSSRYSDAQNDLAFILLAEEDIDGSLAISEKMIERNPRDIYALVNAMLACQRKGDEERENRYNEMIESLDVRDATRLALVCSAYADAGNDPMCRKYFSRLCDIYPHFRDPSLAYALSLYNVGKRREAKELILSLRKLYPQDHTIAYYARFVIGGKVPRIPVSTSLPIGESKRRAHRVDEAFSSLKNVDLVVERLEKDEELREMTLWLLDTNDVEICSRIGTFLCQHEDWQPYIRDRLINIDVPPAVKKEYLFALLMYADHKKFALLVGDMMLFFTPRLPRCDDTYKMREAYWRVFSVCTFAVSGFQQKINRVYKNLVSLMSEPEREAFAFEPRAMAAVIAHEALSSEPFNNVMSCCEVFDCEPQEYDDIVKRLGLPTIKKEKKKNGGKDAQKAMRKTKK